MFFTLPRNVTCNHFHVDGEALVFRDLRNWSPSDRAQSWKLSVNDANVRFLRISVHRDA